MMSKTITLVTVLFCCFTAALSQQQVAVNSAPAPEGYDLEVEVVAEDIGVLISPITFQAVDLTGYSCTRLYVTMNNATDFMSSVSGDATNPTIGRDDDKLSSMPCWVQPLPMASTRCFSGSTQSCPMTAG